MCAHIYRKGSHPQGRFPREINVYLLLVSKEDENINCMDHSKNHLPISACCVPV